MLAEGHGADESFLTAVALAFTIWRFLVVVHARLLPVAHARLLLGDVDERAEVAKVYYDPRVVVVVPAFFRRSCHHAVRFERRLDVVVARRL